MAGVGVGGIGVAVGETETCVAVGAGVCPAGVAVCAGTLGRGGALVGDAATGDLKGKGVTVAVLVGAGGT